MAVGLNSLKGVFASAALGITATHPNDLENGQTANHTLQQTTEALGISSGDPVQVNTDQITPSTAGQKPDLAGHQQQVGGQRADVEHQKGAFLGQIQDVKQKIATTFVDIAKDRGHTVGDAKSAITPAPQSNMVDAATQVATAGTGSLVQAVSLYQELRGSMKGMSVAEARSIMEEVKVKLQTAKHDTNFGFETQQSNKGPDHEIDLEKLTADDLLEFMNTPEEKFTEEFDEALDQLDVADDQILAVEEFFNDVIAAAIENNDDETLSAIGANNELTSGEVEALVSFEISGLKADEPLIPTEEIVFALDIAEPAPVTAPAIEIEKPSNGFNNTAQSY